MRISFGTTQGCPQCGYNFHYVEIAGDFTTPPKPKQKDAQRV